MCFKEYWNKNIDTTKFYRDLEMQTIISYEVILILYLRLSSGLPVMNTVCP